MDALAGLAAKGYISVELCGSWLWISGDTRNFKDYIKATGCKWSGKKKMWYWHPGDFKRRGHGWTIERIRERFGISLIAVVKDGRASGSIGPDTVLHADEMMVLSGTNRSLGKFQDSLQS